MAHGQIIREVKAGKFAPIYLLHGEEPFYIEEIAGALKDGVVDEASKDFNETNDPQYDKPKPKKDESDLPF